MSYQDALERLGTTAERSILAELGRYTSGQISLDTFVDLAATVVALGQQQGRLAAELAVLAWLQSIGAAPVPVAAPPIEHYMDSKRVRDAIWTVVGSGAQEQLEMRLGRLAHAETVESSQRAFNEALQRSGLAEGWIRGLEAGACQLCRWWWREGQAWPVDHVMPTHKGCTCTPIPVEKK